ncbi:MAG: hypothetical protein HXX10_08115 [Rhodoplanes sp.]|uniref:hypothetical protein n=1 Tax=Rhodoplanes sp. TaxID=1968906 RepID=UPI0017B3D161|nr:hypothetical protein [Rhodoplanes sp.]NVO13987.1 hypothetical protein [Rhodoplanes sp.]
MKHGLAAISIVALMVAAAAPASAADGSAAAPAPSLGWTEVGPQTATFGPAPRTKLGAILSPDLLAPVTMVRPGRSYDLEAFSPHLTGSKDAPAQFVVDPLYGKAPLMAQGVE